ncbi:FAM172 family protein homolog CG10038 [Athalia rosae]|uniref:FAM172 family protein homolog CG10038 n=1 Tax=Athalia rosae TaxID=37344 RepID=UPI002033F5C6|nr:FAM172 family protein homolog CG10038 [Athalia rosae]
MLKAIHRSFHKVVNSGVKSVGEMGDLSFPATLREFGYDFDGGGKLRKLDPESGNITHEPFEFNVSDDHAFNQKRYEALGQIIDNYVYDILEKDAGLTRLPVPGNSASLKTPELSSFIFASPDALINEKLMILIHGSGVVRAGQWARRLIINDSLRTGTQLPYIKRAKELGYGVMVLNTNDNLRNVDGKQLEIPGSEDPHKHFDTVWKDYVKDSKAKHVAIVAHSYGGVCVVKFASDNPQDFQDRVFAVGLTDSVHTTPRSSEAETKHMLKVARNWVSSTKPLDTPERTPNGEIERCSAGHETHEMTSSSCMESLFDFIERLYNDKVQNTDRPN